MPITPTEISLSAGRESQADLLSVLPTQETELIGEVAQAMANQFNNIMMAVTSYAELELKKASRTERNSLEKVLTHATRATSLIQTLLNLSRRHISAPRPVEIDLVMSDLNELLRDLLGERIELAIHSGAARAMARVDRFDLEHAALALAVIARNAMAGVGRITINTSVTNLDRQFIGSQSEAQAGTYIMVSFSSKASREAASRSGDANLNQSLMVNRSFAAVREVIKGCHGLVRLTTDPETGCSLNLYLPAAEHEVIDEQGPTLPRNPAVARTILVVEDDDAVRVPASEFLMMEGFKVLQARTGSEALQVVQQSRSALDILVTDVLMPKMNGHELAAQLLAQYSNLKILYMSGDPGRTSESKTAGASQHSMLRKPFRLNALRDRIHDLLGE